MKRRQSARELEATGYMRDELGDYDLAFLVMAGLTFLGAVLFLIAKKPNLPGLLGAEAPVLSGQK